MSYPDVSLITNYINQNKNTKIYYLLLVDNHSITKMVQTLSYYFTTYELGIKKARTPMRNPRDIIPKGLFIILNSAKLHGLSNSYK